MITGTQFFEDAGYQILNVVGSSGTPISPYWFATATHVFPRVGGDVRMEGVEQPWIIREVINMGWDVSICRVDRRFPSWHNVGIPESSAFNAHLTGYGRVGLVGQVPGFPRLPLTGDGEIFGEGRSWQATFRANKNFSVCPVENDSGGGVFGYAPAPGGAYRNLVGIITNGPRIAHDGSQFGGTLFDKLVVDNIRQFIQSPDVNNDGVVDLQDVWYFISNREAYECQVFPGWIAFITAWFAAR